MIDPSKITNFNLNDAQLEEYILFWTLVAGKTANTTAKNLDKLLSWLKLRQKYETGLFTFNCSPFHLIRTAHESLSPTNPHWLAEKMKELGIGCYNHKSRAYIELAYSNLDLRTCSAENLEQIHGIGMKTSRCFIMHSRANSDYAGLDTHILAFLRDLQYDTPKSTPTSKRKYQDIEVKFLFLSQVAARSPAKLDLLIWRVYSQHPNHKSLLLRIMQTRLKNFKFSDHNQSEEEFHVYSDNDTFIIASTHQEARDMLQDYLDLSGEEMEDIHIQQFPDNMQLRFNGKRLPCFDWINIFGPGIIPN